MAEHTIAFFNLGGFRFEASSGKTGSIRIQQPFLRIFFEVREYYKNTEKLRTRGKVGAPELGKFRYIYLENIFFLPHCMRTRLPKYYSNFG